MDLEQFGKLVEEQNEVVAESEDLKEKVKELNDRHRRDMVTIAHLNITVDVLMGKLIALQKRLGDID